MNPKSTACSAAAQPCCPGCEGPISKWMSAGLLMPSGRTVLVCSACRVKPGSAEGVGLALMAGTTLPNMRRIFGGDVPTTTGEFDAALRLPAGSVERILAAGARRGR